MFMWLVQMLSRLSHWIFTGYLKGANSFPAPLSNQEEEELLALSAQGDRDARDKLIEHNLRLVAHIVKKYAPLSGSESEDLISIGTIGLIKAIQSFDAQKSKKLSTYASKCIQNELLMWIRSSKKSQHDVYLQDSVSVDKEGNSIALLDLISTHTEDITDQLYTKMKIKTMRELLESELSPRENFIIKMRYGLAGEAPKTQFEIADELHISRSYVSRIEKKALKKLARVLKDEENSRGSF